MRGSDHGDHAPDLDIVATELKLHTRGAESGGHAPLTVTGRTILSAHALSTTDLFEARTLFDGEEHPIHLRMSDHKFCRRCNRRKWKKLVARL